VSKASDGRPDRRSDFPLHCQVDLRLSPDRAHPVELAVSTQSFDIHARFLRAVPRRYNSIGDLQRCRNLELCASGRIGPWDDERRLLPLDGDLGIFRDRKLVGDLDIVRNGRLGIENSETLGKGMRRRLA